EQGHSSGSTNTSISPPHGRPTSSAMSSVIPYVSRRDVPPASTSCAASTTSPSTQPPETEPASSPLSPTASFEPMGRGADRRVATTVASATFSPRARQRSICGSSSFTRCRLPPQVGLPQILVLAQLLGLPLEHEASGRQHV